MKEYNFIRPLNRFLDEFKKTNGALSVTEAIAIVNLAAEAPQGLYMELGVFHGKSAMSAVQTLKDGLFYLVDPIFENTHLDSEVLKRIMNSSQNSIAMATFAKSSIDVIPLSPQYCYVMVDSGDHDSLVMEEVKLLEDRMVEDGIIVFHDYNSQFIKVKEAHEYLINTGKYENIPIKWEEIIEYVNENNLEQNNLSWHHAQMKNPNFVGAVKRK